MNQTSNQSTTMPTVYPYLYFAGRCEEALAFYKEVMSAQIDSVFLFKDSPEPIPTGLLQDGFEKKVMHCSFHIGKTTLLASDGCNDSTVISGFSLNYTVSTEAEARRVFDLLAHGGQIRMPMDKTFWSPCYGMVTDRFGVSWMVMVPEAMK